MQTTLARRQRHRRSLNRRPTGRSGTVIRGILIAIPIVVLLVTIMLAGAGRCSPWPRTTSTRRGCPTRARP